MERIQKNNISWRILSLIAYVSTILVLQLSNNKTVGIITIIFMCLIAIIGMALNLYNLKKYHVTLKEELIIISEYTIIFLLVDLITQLGIPLIYDLLGISVVSENQQGVENSVKNDFSVLLIFFIIVVGPIIEEALFRFLPRIIFKNNIIFILVSSFVFALMHSLEDENIFFVFLLYLPNAICLAYAYYKTNDLFVPMFMHIIHNAISILLILNALE